MLAHGWFLDLARTRGDTLRAAAAACLVAVLVAKIAGRLRTSERRRSSTREVLSDIELGLLLLTATYVFLAAIGGVRLAGFPAGLRGGQLPGHLPPHAGRAAARRAAIGFEAVMAFGPGAAPEAAAAFPGHAVFIVVFGGLNVVFLHAEVARQRREHQRRLETEVASMREEARDFRLISTALSSENRVRTRAEEEEKLSQGSIETIHQQLFSTLDLLRKSLGLQTCALLWLDAAGEKLKVKEVVTDGPPLAEGPFPARTGVLGAILKEGKPLCLEAPRPQLLPYYDGPVEVDSFLGVPVVEGRSCAGMLVADRRGRRSFSRPRAGSGGQRRRAGRARRAVGAGVPGGRALQARARTLLQRVGGAQPRADPGRGLRRGHRGRARGVRVRLCRDRHLRPARRQPHRPPGGRRRRRSAGRHDAQRSLVDGVDGGQEQAGAARPAASGASDDVSVFDPSVRIREFRVAADACPCLVKDEVIGTFTVAARRAGAFPSDRREMLGVIANQVAISLQNGRMYQTLEEQATTDGLTGLVNHRTFQERFTAMLTRAERHGCRWRCC